MSNFIGANLLASVEKKMFPNGVAVDIVQRLDQMEMAFVNNEAPDNLDSFDLKKPSVSASAYSMFKTYGKNSEQLAAACKEAKMQIKVDSLETKYVADAEQTGSVSVYTFTNRRGEKVEINDINAQEYIDREKHEVDNILQTVLDEIMEGHINLSAYKLDDTEQAA